MTKFGISTIGFSDHPPFNGQALPCVCDQRRQIMVEVRSARFP